MKEKQKQYQIFRECLKLNLQDYIQTHNGHEMSDVKLDAALKVFDEHYKKVSLFDSAQEHFKIETTTKEIQSVPTHVAELRKLTSQYYENKKVRNVELLESIKVQMTQHLEPLCEIADKILGDENYLEIILKTIRGEVVTDLRAGGESVTIVVEKARSNPNYKYYATQYATIKKSSRTIVGQYRFYKDVWEQIKNSVATAKNLKHRSDQTNN